MAADCEGAGGVLELLLRLTVGTLELMRIGRERKLCQELPSSVKSSRVVPAIDVPLTLHRQEVALDGAALGGLQLVLVCHRTVVHWEHQGSIPLMRSRHTEPSRLKLQELHDPTETGLGNSPGLGFIELLLQQLAR